MELNKTKCLACGFVNSWYGYKWANDDYRREHNKLNSTTCVKCGSTNVTNHEDKETMGFYQSAASSIAAPVEVVTPDPFPAPAKLPDTYPSAEETSLYSLKLVLGNLYAAQRLVTEAHPAHSFLKSAIDEMEKLTK
jgi:hypothetical protein